jgi:hypothetical protein
MHRVGDKKENKNSYPVFQAAGCFTVTSATSSFSLPPSKKRSSKTKTQHAFHPRKKSRETRERGMKKIFEKEKKYM